MSGLAANLASLNLGGPGPPSPVRSEKMAVEYDEGEDENVVEKVIDDDNVDLTLADLETNDVRIAMIGNVDSGKSTLIGVLTRGNLDDGRGGVSFRKSVNSEYTTALSFFPETTNDTAFLDFQCGLMGQCNVAEWYARITFWTQYLTLQFLPSHTPSRPRRTGSVAHNEAQTRAGERSNIGS